VTVGHITQEKDIDLVDMGQVENRINVPNLYRGAAFFPGFPGGAFLQGFPVFHEAGGQGPVALAGLDGTFAEQNATFPDRDGANHDLRVLVMDGAAMVAPIAGPVVSFGNRIQHFLPAMAAILHDRSRRGEVRQPTGSPEPWQSESGASPLPAERAMVKLSSKEKGSKRVKQCCEGPISGWPRETRG